MKSIIVKNKWMIDRNLLTVISEYGLGWGNGYVLIDENHPFYNMSYENIPVNVHGGLTFGRIITPDILHIFNKDIDPPYLNESDIGKYMVGFDTCHYNDNLQNWNEENVTAETLHLKKQLCDLSND